MFGHRVVVHVVVMRLVGVVFAGAELAVGLLRRLIGTDVGGQRISGRAMPIMRELGVLAMPLGLRPPGARGGWRRLFRPAWRKFETRLLPRALGGDRRESVAVPEQARQFGPWIAHAVTRRWLVAAGRRGAPRASVRRTIRHLLADIPGYLKRRGREQAARFAGSHGPVRPCLRRLRQIDAN